MPLPLLLLCTGNSGTHDSFAVELLTQRVSAYSSFHIRGNIAGGSHGRGNQLLSHDHIRGNIAGGSHILYSIIFNLVICAVSIRPDF